MQNYLKEARKLLFLAIPILISQLSQTAMGFVDTIMAGDVSKFDMSAVSIGGSIWLPTILFGHGILQVLMPIVSHFNGANEREKIAFQIRQGFWLATFISIVLMVVLYNGRSIINLMNNVDAKLVDISAGYLKALTFGVPGYLFFQVLRSQTEGLSKTKPSMIIGFIGLLLNIPINYIFIYGKFGLPALGGVGCGVATAAVYWAMFFCLKWYVNNSPSQQDIKMPESFTPPDKKTLIHLFKLGIPFGFALFFEVAMFAIVSLLLSPLGVDVVTAHQAALNFSSVMFVLPLSFGIAVTVRVGYRLGQGSLDNTKATAYTGMALGISISLLTALFTVIFREKIAGIYIKPEEIKVIKMASGLMFLAAVYQISDAVQLICFGVLRGYHDTKAIFIITFISYWVFGLPAGYTLALTDNIVPRMGAYGFWWGFIIGLSIAAILAFFRMRWLQANPQKLKALRATG